MPETLNKIIGEKPTTNLRTAFARVQYREQWLQKAAREHGVSFECVARAMHRKEWARYIRLCQSCGSMFTETRPPCMSPLLHVCEDCASREWARVNAVQAEGGVG